MTRGEKADLQELIGIAVNTSALVTAAHENALDRVAALGAAALAISSGADLQGLPVAAVMPEVYRRSLDIRELMLDPGMPDERDVLAGELGPLLWHLRYGGQYGLLTQAVRLYVRWLRHKRLFADLADEKSAPLLHRFAARVLHEWLSDRCMACGGSGKLERTRTGSWIRPRGSMQRNATFRPCGACGGKGLAMPRHAERARWLEIQRHTYDEERWPQRFNAASTWLKFLLADRMKRPLTAQLERRKRRA